MRGTRALRERQRGNRAVIPRMVSLAGACRVVTDRSQSSDGAGGHSRWQKPAARFHSRGTKARPPQDPRRSKRARSSRPVFGVVHAWVSLTAIDLGSRAGPGTLAPRTVTNTLHDVALLGQMLIQKFFRRGGAWAFRTRARAALGGVIIQQTEAPSLAQDDRDASSLSSQSLLVY